VFLIITNTQEFYYNEENHLGKSMKKDFLDSEFLNYYFYYNLFVL